MRTHDSILAMFLDAAHAEGSIIPKSYFWALFDLEEPKGMMHVKEKEKRDLQFMSAMTELVDALLSEHKKDLQNVRGDGYVLIPWQDRVDKTVRDTKKAMKKLLKKGVGRLANIPNAEQLTYMQQRERDSALLAYDMARRLINARRRYPE